MNTLALSSWSVHRSLGHPGYADGPEGRTGGTKTEAVFAMEELPQLLAERNWPVLEVVDFQIADTSAAGLQALRQAVAQAGVSLATVLIDTGDITHPDPTERRKAIEYNMRWIDHAATLGAQAVRVQPGDQDPHDPAVVRRCIAGLQFLAGYAEARGVHCRTENFRKTGTDAEVLSEILEACDGRVSCCIDFGNAESFADKYQGLKLLAPFGSAVHLKARYQDHVADVAELHRCLEPIKESGYQGHISLIHGEHPDEWQDLQVLADVTTEYLQQAAT